MLVLARYIKGIIRINHDIKIKVLRISVQGKPDMDLSNAQVHLGIEAPKSVLVNREEIYQKLSGENMFNQEGISYE
jgi:carbon storage regulator CsrA